MSKFRQPALWWAVVSGLLIILGCFGTWGIAEAGPFSAKVSGIDRGGDGTILIFTSVASLTFLMIWAAVRRSTWGLLVPVLVLSAFTVVGAIADASSSANGDFIREDVRDRFTPSVGWGLYVVGLAGASLFVATVVLLVLNRGRNKQLTPERQYVGGPTTSMPTRTVEPATPIVKPSGPPGPPAAPASPAPAAPAGWYADPSTPGGPPRWWDGTRWAETPGE